MFKIAQTGDCERVIAKCNGNTLERDYSCLGNMGKLKGGRGLVSCDSKSG